MKRNDKVKQYWRCGLNVPRGEPHRYDRSKNNFLTVYNLAAPPVGRRTHGQAAATDKMQIRSAEGSKAKS